MAAQSEITIIETAEKAIPRTTRGEITTRVIRTIAEIEEIRPVWEKWSVHPNSDIDFYLWYTRTAMDVVRPHIVVVYRDHRPEAILVARIVSQHLDLRIGYKSLLRPKARVLNVIHTGVLGDVDATISRVIIRHLLDCSRSKEIDVIAFNFLNSASPLCKDVMQLPGLLSRDRFPLVQSHWSMQLPESAEELFRGLSADHRAQIRRKSKKLMADFRGEACVRCIHNQADLDVLFRDVEEIAKKTYQRGLGVGFVDNAQMRERLNLLASKGQLRAYLLYILDLPAAFWVGTIYHGVFHSEFLGYDPKYEKYSPGTFLFSRMIEGFCKEKLEGVDFGLGEARYKEQFGNQNWEEISAYIYARHFAGLRLCLLRTSIVCLDRGIKKFLRATNLLALTKRAWRYRLKYRQALQIQKKRI